ncbi:hypothetical protein ABZ907_47085 [Nonomuraea wenchangensis]
MIMMPDPAAATMPAGRPWVRSFWKPSATLMGIAALHATIRARWRSRRQRMPGVGGVAMSAIGRATLTMSPNPKASISPATAPCSGVLVTP